MHKREGINTSHFCLLFAYDITDGHVVTEHVDLYRKQKERLYKDNLPPILQSDPIRNKKQ